MEIKEIVISSKQEPYATVKFEGDTKPPMTFTKTAYKAWLNNNFEAVERHLNRNIDKLREKTDGTRHRSHERPAGQSQPNQVQ